MMDTIIIGGEVMKKRDINYEERFFEKEPELDWDNVNKDFKNDRHAAKKYREWVKEEQKEMKKRYNGGMKPNFIRTPRMLLFYTSFWNMLFSGTRHSAFSKLNGRLYLFVLPALLCAEILFSLIVHGCMYEYGWDMDTALKDVFDLRMMVFGFEVPTVIPIVLICGFAIMVMVKIVQIILLFIPVPWFNSAALGVYAQDAYYLHKKMYGEFIDDGAANRKLLSGETDEERAAKENEKERRIEEIRKANRADDFKNEMQIYLEEQEKKEKFRKSQE